MSNMINPITVMNEEINNPDSVYNMIQKGKDFLFNHEEGVFFDNIFELISSIEDNDLKEAVIAVATVRSFVNNKFSMPTTKEAVMWFEHLKKNKLFDGINNLYIPVELFIVNEFYVDEKIQDIEYINFITGKMKSYLDTDGDLTRENGNFNIVRFKSILISNLSNKDIKVAILKGHDMILLTRGTDNGEDETWFVDKDRDPTPMKGCDAVVRHCWRILNGFGMSEVIIK